MGDIDQELVNLRQNLSKINGAYAEVDNTLKFKWKEIKKLDSLENDLGKLKHLSELPNMFKQAIQKYESKEKGVEAFQEPIKYFDDYQDILHHYKQTVCVSILLILLEFHDYTLFRDKELCGAYKDLVEQGFGDTSGWKQ